MFLSAYQSDLQFRTTEKHDGFSQLTILVPFSSNNIANVWSIFNVNQISILPVDSSQLWQTTRKDPVLGKVMVYLKEEWPNKFDDEL